ncbi:hypothetical protein PGT21_035092 [Puccinia graminis f. sp. tritici]|uniref:Uncharacterized protein n=1 Tax=Puccinia graminis f. sp. tritici TaxID=56615 RepID=A0A5B0NQD0_PUCGR|nr:hypothetical protein PGT21_035092 [Puccinia graminis f. sp. tritici]
MLSAAFLWKCQKNTTPPADDYLFLTPSQINTILHKGKASPATSLIYSADQLNEIAHSCLIDLQDYFNLYAARSPQEALACVYLVTRHQDHFSAFLKAVKLLIDRSIAKQHT